MGKSKVSIYLTMLTMGIAIMIGVIAHFEEYAVADYLVYDDSTVIDEPEKDDVLITYDVTEFTNGDVVATFETNNADIEILNNGGNSTYIFKENGEFSFVYLNKKTGIEKSIIAKVTWIDKEVPTARIIYDFSSKTNKAVKATLVPSEDVKVLNNDYTITDDLGNIIVGDPYEFTFVENGEFTFEFEDKAGNKGSAFAKVDWIDKKMPTAILNYDIISKTNLPVKVQVTFDKENVSILNNEGKNYYIFNENGEFVFEYIDEAGNVGSVKAVVNWIEKKNEVIQSKPSSSSNNQVKNDEKKDKENLKDEEDEIKTFKMYSDDNIEFELESSVSKENIELKKKQLMLSEELINRFNKDCEYFEIYFENTNKEKIEIATKKGSTLTILLNGTKAFKNVYLIDDSGKVQVIDFKIVNGNKAEIKGATTGKYLVEYEEKANNSSNNLVEVGTEEENNFQVDVAVVVCAVVIGIVILMAIICVFIKNY